LAAWKGLRTDYAKVADHVDTGGIRDRAVDVVAVGCSELACPQLVAIGVVAANERVGEPERGLARKAVVRLGVDIQPVCPAMYTPPLAAAIPVMLAAPPSWRTHNSCPLVSVLRT